MVRLLKVLYGINGRNQASKSPKDLEVFFYPFLEESNFRNKQSMVQYSRSCEDDVGPQRKSRTNHMQVRQTCISKANLIFFYGGCKAMHRANFLQVRQRTVASFQNPNLTNKSWVVHLYCTLMARGVRSIDINGRREISAKARYHYSFWAIVQGERFSVTYLKADRVKKCDN